VNNPIVFPNLGIEIDPSPVAFSIGSREFFWYGIIIAAGFVLGSLVSDFLWKKYIKKDDAIFDFLIVVTPMAVVGARIYYIIFNLSLFHSLGDMLSTWNGGLALYGALIFGVVTAVIYAKVKRLPMTALLDVAVCGFILGQAIGRWGNFFNRECYGVKTGLPWAMEVYSDFYMRREAVHPTFLYESLWNFLGFALLFYIFTEKRKFNGQTLLVYLAWYGFGRFFIEGLRTDSLYIWGTSIRVSQAVAALTFTISLALLIVFFATKCYKKMGLEIGGAIGDEGDAPDMREDAEDGAGQDKETDEKGEQEHGDNHEVEGSNQ